jgi:iron(III) transport system permease protein
MKRFGIEAAVYAGLWSVIAFLVLYPLGMLLAGTIQGDSGVTLQHWRDTLALPILGEIIFNSVLVSVLATLAALVLGLLLAFLVGRTDMPMRSAFEYISIVPFLTPPIIAGMAWQQLAERQSGIFNVLLQSAGVSWRFDVMSLAGVIFVSTLYLVPFVFLMTVSALRSINPELEEASLTMGASRTRTFLRVTMPLLLPSLSSAALLSFMYSNVLFGIHATLGMPVNLWFLTTAVYQSMSIVPAQIHRAAILACLLMVIAVVATYLQARALGGDAGYQTIHGKGLRGKTIALGHWRWIAWLICAAYIIVVSVLPYLVLFLRSLKPFMFQPGMTWADLLTGWEFRRYAAILQLRDDTVTRSMWNSLVLAIAASALGTALTGLAAYFLTRSKLAGRTALHLLCMVPIALPGVVLGVAVLWGYSQPYLMLYGTLWILLVAYVTKDLPLGLKSAHSSFLQVHPELEESSRVCGAGWLRQLRTITLPLVKPGLVIGFVLTFASILREVGASILLYSQGTEVVAYVLFNLWENGELQALSAFIIVTTILTLLVTIALLRLGRLRFADLTGAEVRQS